MIQNPQQQDTIEIPSMNSMNATANNLNKKKILDKTRNQKNDKGQNPLIQIPPQNSKPRIFLLTKPSKQPLVRLETQTVPQHDQRILNMSQREHSQKTSAAAPMASMRQKTPFLPGLPVQTCSEKNNTNQTQKNDSEKSSIPYQNKSQAMQFPNYTLQENPIIKKQVTYLPPPLKEANSNQLQTQQKGIKSTLTKSTVGNLTLSKNKSIETQTQAQSKTPLTLTSMAGIELTVADMSLSQADMSGAMPPTATVEEINVPVFIDEYLQEATASNTSVTANNIPYINNNILNNISNHSNDLEHEVHNFLDTLDNFEFDINLLAENKKTTLEVKEDPHHLQSTGMDGDKDLQTMLEEILFNNNNNNNTSNNYTTTINSRFNNISNMASNIDITDDLFKVAPYTELNDFLSQDDIENASFGATQFNSEEAIDLNNISKDFSLDECFINSQPTEIMFSSGYSQSQSSSQNLINEISKAEPHITPKCASVLAASVAAPNDIEECNFNDEGDTFYTVRYEDNDSIVDCKETKLLGRSPLKRHSSQTSQHMLEKHRKLRLDTKLCRESVLSQQPEITTPKVIDFIDQFNEVIMCTTATDSIQNIYYDLISSSPQSVSVKSEINVEDTLNDYSPPNTPYSVNSVSNQTTFSNTAPNSPASSIATTSNTSPTIKRGRGRPAKTHSDIPDRSQIQHLSENEQKKVLERAKNNEASRKSRLKHKERHNALEREETELKIRNQVLEKEWEKWKKIEKKLKTAMKRQYYQFQTDQ